MPAGYGGTHRNRPALLRIERPLMHPDRRIAETHSPKTQLRHLALTVQIRIYSI